MNPARTVVIAAYLVFLTAQPALCLQDDALLEQSYNLSQKLGGSERLYYLIELCRVSAQLQPPATRAKQWCNEAYNVAAEQGGKLRTAAQKNAVAFLSNLDAPGSLQLLTQIPFQKPKPGEFVYEDQRYNAAGKIFLNYLKVKPGDLGAIAVAARSLGQTGQFPYRAIAALIDNFPPNQPGGDINNLLKDALAFYAAETGFYNRDEEFLVLLQSVSQSPSVNKDLAEHMAAAFVHHLDTDPIQLSGDYYAEVHVEPSGTVFPFVDRNAAFRFRAIGAIQRCNASLATQLIQQDPNLGQATTGELQYVSGGFVQGDPTAEEAAQQHLQWIQDSLVDRIRDCHASNPQSAAQLAQRLNNPESRILGFAAVASGFASSDKQRATAIYQTQFSELANLNSAMSRFRAIAALVRPAYRLGQAKQYESLSAQALDIGSSFVAEDTTANRVQNRKGFTELMDLVVFTAQSGDILKPRIQALPEDWLKAYLWLCEVEGRGKEKVRAPSLATCTK
jgi:hypothetical protein